MKVIAHGPYSGTWPNGTIFSPMPGQLVEVDDGDQERVAYLRGLAPGGLVTILEDAPPEQPSEPTLEELKARAVELGLPTYGTKAQLADRIAKAESGKEA